MLTCNKYIGKSILKYLLMHITSSNAKKVLTVHLTLWQNGLTLNGMGIVNQMSNSKDG